MSAIPVSKPAKSQYTEAEAAQALGISTDQLRVLIRKHIVVEDEASNSVPMASFQPSDLLLLKLLAGNGSTQNR